MCFSPSCISVVEVAHPISLQWLAHDLVVFGLLRDSSFQLPLLSVHLGMRMHHGSHVQSFVPAIDSCKLIGASGRDCSNENTSFACSGLSGPDGVLVGMEAISV
jgi:hypothetical protein